VTVDLCESDGTAVVATRIGDTKVVVADRPVGLAVEGVLGPLSVSDVRPAAASTARDIVGSGGLPVGQFVYREWYRDTPVYPGHDAEIELRVRALTVVYNEPALLWLVRPRRGDGVTAGHGP